VQRFDGHELAPMDALPALTAFLRRWLLHHVNRADRVFTMYLMTLKLIKKNAIECDVLAGLEDELEDGGGEPMPPPLPALEAAAMEAGG
jgi:hypothetical protein